MAIYTKAKTLTLARAADFSTERLAHLLNHAYADYYIPIQFNGCQFEQMCNDMDVSLTKSVVAVVDKAPVGMALLSLRGTEGWISGVGVLPEWRRCGIGRAIIAQLQDVAQDDHLTRLRLEVLHENKAARQLYETKGFEWHRDLQVLRMNPKADLPEYDSLPLTWARPRALLRLFPAFHHVEPSWQRALPSLQKRSDRIQGFGLWQNAALAGYALYQAQPDICHILDLAVDPMLDECVDIARHMLLTLHRMYPDLGGYIVNVPAEDPLLAAFIDIGYRVWHHQDEMVWPVPKEPGHHGA